VSLLATSKAWELNPHNCYVALFSKQARRTVSGYLPIQASGIRGQTSGNPWNLNPETRHLSSGLGGARTLLSGFIVHLYVRELGTRSGA
jgi:hypothetical protein